MSMAFTCISHPMVLNISDIKKNVSVQETHFLTGIVAVRS